MARYIEKEPLCAWLENMGVSDFIIRKIESEANFPTADVAPKSEVAMEIFEEIETSLMIESFHGSDVYYAIRAEDYLHYKKKYTEEHV